MSYSSREIPQNQSLLKIADRKWTFRAKTPESIIDWQVVFLKGNTTKSISSLNFWQKIYISNKNIRNDNWATCHIPQGKYHKSITSRNFWQKMDIPSKNLTIDHWSTGRIPRGKYHKIDYTSNFLIFDQKMMISTAGRKNRLDHYWWFYDTITILETILRCITVKHAFQRVRASSPAAHYCLCTVVRAHPSPARSRNTLSCNITADDAIWP